VEEKRSATTGPDVIQLERRDGKYIMSVAHSGQSYVVSELDSLALNEEVYVGLFVCAQNNDVVEKATFSNVSILVPAGNDHVPYKD
jgi:hypothetical protein